MQSVHQTIKLLLPDEAEIIRSGVVGVPGYFTFRARGGDFQGAEEEDRSSQSVRHPGLADQLFSVLIYFYHSLYISALINITSAYFFLLAYYFNSRKSWNWAGLFQLSILTCI